MLKRREKAPKARTIKLDSFCSMHAAKLHRHYATRSPRRPTDQPIEPMPGELETVGTMLGDIAAATFFPPTPAKSANATQWSNPPI